MSSLFTILAMGSGGAVAPPLHPVVPTPAPAAPYKLGPDTHLIIDANSYYALWTYAPIQEIGALKQLITSAGATVSNTAIPGQTWSNMRVNNEDVVAAFRPGKRNILICGETRNWVATHGGCTVNDVAMEATLYIAATRTAVQARYGQDFDRVVLCGTIPNSTFLDEPWKNDIPGMNKVLSGFDDMARADPGALGADVFADFRSKTRWFSGDGTTRAPFAQTQDTVKEPISGTDWVHPVGEAREAFAAAIADALKSLES